MSDFLDSGDNGFSVDTDFVEELPAKEEPIPVSKSLIEWLEVISSAIIAVIIIFCFLFRVATIDGSSMLNTLENSQKVIITKIGYEPKQGDIVVISRNALNNPNGESASEGPIIKRVIALEGQTIDIDFDTGEVKVDGVTLHENYISTPTKRQGDVEFPLTVPKGHVFVMGDNRMDSLDSRFAVIGDNGPVDKRYILGHAVFRIFPLNKAGRLDNK